MTHVLTLAELETSPACRRRVSGGAVSIGNFDGVHVGHRELLGQVRSSATAIGGPAIAIILDPHPAAVLRPHSAPPRLTTIARRAELMTPLGIDFLVVCVTTIEFLNRTAEEFFEYLIVERLQARSVVEGPNFFFGRDRGGDVHSLRTLCQASDVSLTVVPPLVDDQRMISSSRIREAIASGEIQLANQMLGSTYELQGRVERGEGRGRQLGFPTANLGSIDVMCPGHGVYAAMVRWVDDASPGRAAGERLPSSVRALQSWAAVHIGPNPTFNNQTATKIEVHCVGYAGDLYGKSMEVALVAKIRDVKRFDGPETLIAQLHRDVDAVRQFQARFSLRS